MSRTASPPGPAGRFGGGIKLGGVGLIAVLAISWFLGLNPLDVLMSLQGEDTASAPTQSAPPPSSSAPGARDETKEFIARVLGDTEDTWSALFKQMGRKYRPPKLVLFRGSADSACGLASSAVGPFYCSSDSRVYLDRSVPPGEFARRARLGRCEPVQYLRDREALIGAPPRQSAGSRSLRNTSLPVRDDS